MESTTWTPTFGRRALSLTTPYSERQNEGDKESELRKKLEEERQQSSRLQIQLTEAEVEVKLLKRQLEEKDALMGIEAAKWQEKVDRADRDAERLRRHVKFLSNEEELAQRRVKELEQRLKSSSSELQGVFSTPSATRHNEGGESEVQSIKEQHDREMNALRAQIRELEAALSESEAIVTVRDAAIADLQSQLGNVDLDRSRLQRLEEENQRLLFDMKQYQQSAQSEDENQPNKRQRVASLEKVEALQATIRRLERELKQQRDAAAAASTLEEQLTSTARKLARAEESANASGKAFKLLFSFEDELNSLLEEVMGVLGKSMPAAPFKLKDEDKPREEWSSAMLAEAEEKLDHFKDARKRLLLVIRDMQGERTFLLETQVEVEGKYKSSEEHRKVLEQKILELEAAARRAKKEIEVLQDRLAREERLGDILRRERDSLRSLLSSYDEEDEAIVKRLESAMKAEAAASSEAPSNDSTTAEGASQGESTGLITPQKAAATPRAATPLLSNTKLASERIKHLEQSLQAAQQELDLMRARQKLFTPKAILERTETKLGEIEKELLEKTEQLKTTEALLEKTEKERDFLQTRVGRGDFNSSTTKVLHLVMNPTRRALELKAEKEKQMEEQIQSLQAQVVQLEQLASQGNSGKGAMGDALQTPMTSRSGAAIPLTATQLDIRKKYDRLREMFQENIAAFREAVYLLTGYKIMMKPSSSESKMVTVTSMFAEAEDDFLRFEISQGDVSLIQTEYCKRMDQRAFDALQKTNSIPVFLATLTEMLFEKSTIV